MANKALFKSKSKEVAVADTVNHAGGLAYSLSAEEALAQYAATCTMNDTFYVSAEAQLDEVLKLAKSVRPEFLAKVAIYSRKNAYLKDVPALLVAVLATRDVELFKKVFPLVIDNARMVRNFVQIIRSGKVGRKSLGSAPKRMIQDWFRKSTDKYLFEATVGNDPSLKDVIKLTHPRPDTKQRAALYSYILGNEYVAEDLPEIVKQYEAFKVDRKVVPDVPFQMLANEKLSTDQWSEICMNAKWQMLRMNLNTFTRHGVFNNAKLVNHAVHTLSNKELVHKARQYPYQIYTAYMNTPDLNGKLSVALQQALDHSLDNVPALEDDTAVLVDISGSMGSAVGASQKVTYIHVAALFASALLRKNPTTRLVLFNTAGKDFNLNPMDSVATNASKIIQQLSGGTAVSSGIEHLLKDKTLPKNVIIISDNESWADGYSWYGGGTATMSSWNKYLSRKKDARMILLDISPNRTSQVAKGVKSVLKVGGFSDQVFDVASAFLNAKDTSGSAWVAKIESDIQIP